MPNNQKGIVQVFILLLLLVGLAVGIYLVQTETNLFPEASVSGPTSGPIPPTPIPTPTATPKPTPIPPSLSYSRVFITKDFYNGNLGGLAGADAKCQDRANAANLGGAWKAWASDKTTSAASRLIQSSNPYKLINGTIVANNWKDLTDKSLLASINVTELNTTNDSSWVWTGTNPDGTIRQADDHGSCASWTSTSVGGTTGDSRRTDGGWSDYGASACHYNRPIYCFEQTAAPSPKQADLIITGIEVLGIPRVGRANSINVRVENIGKASAKFAQVNQDNVSILVTGGGVTLGNCSGRLRQEIKPGEKTSLQIRNCPKFTRTGTHKLTGRVDYADVISESNEDNNYNVIQVTVSK